MSKKTPLPVTQSDSSDSSDAAPVKPIKKVARSMSSSDSSSTDDDSSDSDVEPTKPVAKPVAKPAAAPAAALAKGKSPVVASSKPATPAFAPVSAAPKKAAAPAQQKEASSDSESSDSTSSDDDEDEEDGEGASASAPKKLSRENIFGNVWRPDEDLIILSSLDPNQPRIELSHVDTIVAKLKDRKSTAVITRYRLLLKAYAMTVDPNAPEAKRERAFKGLTKNLTEKDKGEKLALLKLHYEAAKARKEQAAMTPAKLLKIAKKEAAAKAAKKASADERDGEAAASPAITGSKRPASDVGASPAADTIATTSKKAAPALLPGYAPSSSAASIAAAASAAAAGAPSGDALVTGLSEESRLKLALREAELRADTENRRLFLAECERQQNALLAVIANSDKAREAAEKLREKRYQKLNNALIAALTGGKTGKAAGAAAVDSDSD